MRKKKRGFVSRKQQAAVMAILRGKRTPLRKHLRSARYGSGRAAQRTVRMRVKAVEKDRIHVRRRVRVPYPERKKHLSR
ncbi:MAG: hypothetical protein ACXAEN_12280 [Candidatus Thorarchaeota archaeon]|jgi:hypothetical protein